MVDDTYVKFPLSCPHCSESRNYEIKMSSQNKTELLCPGCGKEFLGSLMKTEKKPDPVIEEQLREMTGTDVKGAILKKIVEIQLSYGEISDILVELRPNKELNDKYYKLHYLTTSSLDFWINNDSYSALKKALKEATEYRRSIRKELLDVLEN